MRSLVGLAELARLVARLPPEEAREAACVAGFEGRAPTAASQIERPREDTPDLSGQIDFTQEFARAVAEVERQRAALDEPSAWWRVERFEAPPKAESSTTPPSEVITDPLLPEEREGRLFATPEAPALAPWRHLWPLLHEALRTDLSGRDPNVAALVRRWTRGEPVLRIPTVTRRAWATRASLWLDRSERLVPLWHDQIRAERGLRKVFGRALEVRWLGAEEAHRARSSLRGWLGGSRIDAATPIVVLSDLGTFRGGDADLWSRAIDALDRDGVRVTALVPWSVRRHPRRVDHAVHLRSWEPMSHRRRTEAADGQPESADAIVETLLTIAAMPAFVQPGLLRALRWLLPDADVEAELRVWSRPEVEGADGTGMMLRTDAARRLRARFQALDMSLQTRVSEVIRHWHASMPHELVHAETLAWLQCATPTIAAPGDATAARTFAARLSQMLWEGSAHEAAAWAHYGRAMLDAMPPSAYRDVPELAKVWAVAYEGIDHATQPEGVDAAALRAQRLAARDTRLWTLRQVGDVLVVAAARDARWPSDVVEPGSPVAVIEAGGAELIVDQRDKASQRILAAGLSLPLSGSNEVTLRTARGALHLAARTKESWAAEMGRDAFGLWARVEVRSVSFRMRWIPPGRFLMGSPKGEERRFANEGPQHEVVLTRGYWLGETPVTQALWEALTGKNPSRFKSADRPVEWVSWEDCARFTAALNGVVPGIAVGFPTEAEWEHACRAGTSTSTWVSDLEILGANNAPMLDEIAWYGGNSGHGFELENGFDSRPWSEKQFPHTRAGTRPVGLKSPNPFGLYDMLGNVWEWCADWDGPYTEREQVNPTGTLSGSTRILRGGSWSNSARYVRAAMRRAHEPVYRHDVIGLRLARGQAALQQAEQVRGATVGRRGGADTRRGGAEGAARKKK